MCRRNYNIPHNHARASRFPKSESVATPYTHAMPAEPHAPALPATNDRATNALLACAGVGLFTFLTALGAQVAFPLPPFGIPQTLQTLAVTLAALGLGAKLGMASMLLYLALGMIGAPLFAEGDEGLAVLLGQTGGYIVGFIACQPVIHAIVRRPDRTVRSMWWIAAAVVAGHVVIFAIGVPWLYFVRGLEAATAITWRDALFHGMVVFLPGMVLKSAIAAIIGRWAAPFASSRGW